jgi:signal peptidase II
VLSVPASLSERNSTTVPRTRYVLFVVIAVVGCVADLWTKHWVFHWRGMPRPDNEWWVWEPFIGIETAINPGALFGMGSGWGHLFAVLSLLAAAGILLAIFRYGAARDLPITVALGAILGGILGNLYDRLGFWYPPGMPGEWRTEVRDWILFRYGDFTWPNFNIADCLLVVGAALLMWRTYWDNAVEAPGDQSGEATDANVPHNTAM